MDSFILITHYHTHYSLSYHNRFALSLSRTFAPSNLKPCALIPFTYHISDISFSIFEFRLRSRFNCHPKHLQFIFVDERTLYSFVRLVHSFSSTLALVCMCVCVYVYTVHTLLSSSLLLFVVYFYDIFYIYNIYSISPNLYTQINLEKLRETE